MKKVVVQDLSFAYSNELILKNINLEIHQNDFILLNGPNGVGKTTLIALILGIFKPLSGKIYCNEGLLKNQLTYLPQKGFFHSVPIKVLDVVASSFVNSNSYFIRGYKKQLEVSWDVLSQLKIQDLAQREFSTLSGGQIQKVLLARVLANPSEFIFLDEPFSNMDEASKEFMMLKLMELKGKSGILIISHDMDLIADHKGKFCYLKQGTLTTYNSIHDMETSFFHDHTHIHHFQENSYDQ